MLDDCSRRVQKYHKYPAKVNGKSAEDGQTPNVDFGKVIESSDIYSTVYATFKPTYAITPAKRTGSNPINRSCLATGWGGIRVEAGMQDGSRGW